MRNSRTTADTDVARSAALIRARRWTSSSTATVIFFTRTVSHYTWSRTRVLEYLFETGRIRARGAEVYDSLHHAIQLRVCSKPFAAVVRQAIGMKWTRDPFDRLITAQAAVDESPLLTKDHTIRTHYPEAAW